MAFGPLTVVWLLLTHRVIPISPAAVQALQQLNQIVWTGAFVGLIVTVMGLFLWFAPNLRLLAGIMACIFSLVSLVTSDYGGFLIGMLLGITGGAMGFAWTPLIPKKIRPTPAPDR